jgi:hypothetical protein
MRRCMQKEYQQRLLAERMATQNTVCNNLIDGDVATNGEEVKNVEVKCIENTEQAGSEIPTTSICKITLENEKITINSEQIYNARSSKRLCRFISEGELYKVGVIDHDLNPDMNYELLPDELSPMNELNENFARPSMSRRSTYNTENGHVNFEQLHAEKLVTSRGSPTSVNEGNDGEVKFDGNLERLLAEKLNINAVNEDENEMSNFDSHFAENPFRARLRHASE